MTWLQPHFANETGRLRMSIHSFLVETAQRRIIVDTCLGNDKRNRRAPDWNGRDAPFLAGLAAAGYAAESIDTVLCTHLHADHVGWNTVTPIIEAGMARIVETDERICEEITLVPTPGHTPGHVSVLIRSRGEQAPITGDFMHHPCQIARPDWSTLVDSAPDQGIATRLEMFQRLAGLAVLVPGTHFAGVTAGRILRDGHTYRLDI